MTRGAGDALSNELRELRRQCTVPATAEGVLDAVRELEPCSLTAIVRHLEARNHGWVRWEHVAFVVNNLVDADQLVMRVVDGPLGRFHRLRVAAPTRGGVMTQMQAEDITAADVLELLRKHGASPPTRLARLLLLEGRSASAEQLQPILDQLVDAGAVVAVPMPARRFLEQRVGWVSYKLA